MDKILRYLAVAESTKIHRISSEPDITAPYGISRHSHPKAEIFKYIDEVADLCDIQLDSTLWTEEDMEIISNDIVFDITKELASKFYEEYLENAHLYLFPEECKVAMYSMYITSPKGAWESVQKAINSYNKNNFINISKIDEDGVYGTNQTKPAMEQILIWSNTDRAYIFEEKMLRYMTMYYDDLCYHNKAKYGSSRNGWRNRLDELGAMR